MLFRSTLTKPPSIIVLDVMMPKRSGFEVLEHIKNNSPYKDVPVIMLSNLAGKEDAQRALDLGAKEYLIKSQYEPKDIVEKISQIIAAEEQKEKQNGEQKEEHKEEQKPASA